MLTTVPMNAKDIRSFRVLPASEYPDAVYTAKEALTYVEGETVEQLLVRAKNRISKNGFTSIELREEIG